MRRSNLTLVLYLLLVFLSGAFAGGFAYRLYFLQTFGSKPPPRRSDEFRRRYLKEMRTRLKLSPQQVTQLDAVMGATRARYDAFRAQHKSEFDAFEAEHVEKVRAILSDTQRLEYEKMRQEHERRRQQGRK
jgi:uncharacterized protein YeaO (DUF488 family)